MYRVLFKILSSVKQNLNSLYKKTYLKMRLSLFLEFFYATNNKGAMNQYHTNRTMGHPVYCTNIINDVQDLIYSIKY